MKKVLEVITREINDQNSFFVFPTDVAASTWSEYLLKEGITKAVSTERFIAWDSFKASCIRSQKQEKNAIPTLLRKFFSQSIIKKNKEKQLFTSIIHPDYLHTSLSFADWITKLLPQLALWHEKLPVQKNLDEEDKDLLLLKNEYEKFLDTHNLFDTAWERPPFHIDGKTYYIFYPEIIQDFLEYKEILENTECIHIINVDENDSKEEVLQYTNVRSELRETALYIRNLCSPIEEGGKGIHWSDVAVSVKDTESFEAYLKQEFLLYNIPLRFRSGKALGKYSGGRLFSLIQDCYNEKFSFDSVKNLILDPTFPWKDTVVADQLIAFGIKHNCLCTYDGKDTWEEAFSVAYSENRAETYYKSLKKNIISMVTATSFEYIRAHYFDFKENFFSIENISEEANTIISRCIAELATIIDLEKTYPEATQCDNPFSFFIDQLNSKEYVIQTKENGVNVFPYKLVATAPFKQHIILDSSQNAITVASQSLSFLREDKRKALGLVDENVSTFFTRLYSLHSVEKPRFSFSKNAFAGYEIPFNAFTPKKVYTEIESKNECNTSYADAYYKEKQLYLEHAEDLKTIYSSQHEGFTNWLQKGGPINESLQHGFLEILKEKLHARVFKNGYMTVSATTLKDFYECPIKWLFTRVLKLEDLTLETNLLDDTNLGTFYHEVLRRVLLKLKEDKEPLRVDENKLLTKHIRDYIIQQTNEVANGFPDSCGIKNLSNLTMEIFNSQREHYIQKLIDFFTEFSLCFFGSYISNIEEDISIKEDGYTLVGKIDCVLDFPGNEFTEQGKFIIDFKTGKTPSRSVCLLQQNQELKDFQLPLYTYMYEQKYFKGKPNIQGCAFMSIHKKTLTPLFGIVKNEYKTTNPNKTIFRLNRCGLNDKGLSFEPTLDETLSAIEGFVETMNDEKMELFSNFKKWGHFPDGSSVSFETCLSCSYKKLCRSTYAISGGRL